MNTSAGLFLVGMGMGIATTQFIFPKLAGTILEGVFWIVWFVLVLAGIIIIIKSH